MPRVVWLIAVVVCGVALVSLLLIVPERGPREVDHPNSIGSGSPVSTTGTPLATLQRIGGRDDLTARVGERAEVVVDIGQAVNDVAFWSGFAADEILIVINRGARSGIQRQVGAPSDTDFTPPPRGLVTVSGVIEPLPYAEAMHSWGLTRRDVAVVQERQVYLRVDRVVSAAPADAAPLRAERVDEFGRETAPPPGEQVETPLDIPPRRP